MCDVCEYVWMLPFINPSTSFGVNNFFILKRQIFSLFTCQNVFKLISCQWSLSILSVVISALKTCQPRKKL